MSEPVAADQSSTYGLIERILGLPIAGPQADKPTLDTLDARLAKEKEEKERWGKLTDGLQSSLRPTATFFKSGETPTFMAAIRNVSNPQKDLLITRAQQLAEIEIDGKWHRWIGDIDAKSSSLLAGTTYDNIAFTLGDGWSPIEAGGRLKLSPGKHTLRVAFLPQTVQLLEQPIRVVSNAIEFEVHPPGATQPAKPAAPKAQLNFRGLDLSKVPVTTDASALPDIFREQPRGSRSYEVHPAVKAVTGTSEGMAWTVYHPPNTNRFYIQHDQIGSSTLHYYGPFQGEMWLKLGLPEP
jgi:hypothetical protein